MMVLVLESSTSSAKAMLLNTKDNTQKSVSEPYKSGTANNPEAVLKQTLSVGSKLAENQAVSIIALGGTWHDFLLCDTKMKPVSPLWSWAETNSHELCKELKTDWSYTRNYYQESGCMVHSIYPYFKIKYFKQKKMIKPVHRIADQGSYMFHQLTGRWLSTPSMASGRGYLNIRKKNYSDRLQSELDLSIEEQFPPMVDLGLTAPLTKEAALRLGLQDGIPVLPCNPDGGLNQVGSDAIQSGVMTLSMGTSAAMRLASDVPYLPDDMSSWCYLSPRGGYINGAATSGCCNCVDWVKESLFPRESSYSEIEKQMDVHRQVPTFLPFLYGERCPGWNDERKASFHNLKPDHNPIDQYQAVLEGVVFNLYQCFQELRKSDFPINQIKLSGGVLNSKEWKQMCCDIFSVSLTEDQATQSSLLGGAKLALECLGEPKTINNMFETGSSLIPNEQVYPLYKERYEEYLHCYTRSK